MVFQCSGYFKLHNCLFIFLCLILVDHVTAQDKNESSETYSRESPKFKNESEWILAPVGESAIQFLELFYAYVNSGPVRFLVYERITDFKRILETVIAYIFRDQHTMANISIIGILGILILLFMPYWIMLYRKDQIKKMEETLLHRSLVSPRQGVLIADFLYPFLTISIFGGILMCFSVAEVRKNLPIGFEFAVSTVNTSYMYKERVVDRYYYNLFDISQSAFGTIQLMHEINNEVHQKFMKEVNIHLDSIIDLAGAVLLDAEDLTKSLTRMRKELEFFNKNSSQNIKNLTDAYLASLTNLKKVFDKENVSKIFELTIDPLFEIANYSSNATFENFGDVIKILQTVVELKLEDKLQNISRYFRDAIENITYNASEIVEDLKRIAFSTEEKTRDIVGFHVPYIKETFTKESKNSIVDRIISTRISVLNTFETVYIVIFVFSALSIFFGAIFTIFFSLGIAGTKGFRIEFPGLRGYKSDLSDVSGKIIVFFLYISAFFLTSFWALSIILFVSSTIPLEMCSAAKDKSLFNFEFDLPTPNKTTDYSGYQMGVFPIVLRNHFRECKKNSSYSRFLPELPFNQSEFYDVKEKVNTENVSNEVRIAFKNIPSINISEISDLDFQAIKNLDINSDFQNIESFTEELNKKNSSLILKSIQDHNRSSNVLKKAAQTALKSFEALTIELSKSANTENYSNSSLRSLNVSMTMIVIEVDHLKLTIEVLNNILKQNMSDLYISIFNETVNDLIDIFAFHLVSSVYSFRKSISFCSSLFIFHRNCVFIICKLLLNPVAAAWMGSFFVAIFLLFSVVLCLYAAPLFLIPARKDFFTRTSLINMSDFPSTPRNRMGPWAQVLHSEESGSTLSNSDGIPATTDVDLSFREISDNSMDGKKTRSLPDVLETCSIETSSDIREEDSKDETTNSVDIENAANIKEIKSLPEKLTGERQNENTTPDSESAKDEHSSNATSTDPELVPENSEDKRTSSVNKENTAYIKEIKSRREKLTGVKQNENISPNSESFNKESSSIITSADIENAANIKEIKPLPEKLTGERRNGNITPDSESAKNEHSSTATSTGTKLDPENSEDKTMNSVDKENTADIKEIKSHREKLTEVNQNENISPNSQSFNKECSSTETSADIENVAKIKETKPLPKMLIGERQIENITPDSESAKNEHSSTATSTDTELVPEDSEDKTTDSLDKENTVDIKEKKTSSEKLTGEKRNENTSPNSESFNEECSSTGTLADTDKIAEDPQETA